MFNTKSNLIFHRDQQHSDPATRYSVVISWLLNLHGCETDERTHGFIFPSKISSSGRTALISEKLGSRMWCDMDAAFIEPEDFEPDFYDTVHCVDA